MVRETLLYHGSHHQITGQLVPHKSFHYVPYVYATSDWRYALIRAGRFDAQKLLLKEDYDGTSFTLIELSPGAAEEAFNTSGYIYMVDPSSFSRIQNSLPNEFVSSAPCDILGIQCVGNILEQITKDPFYRILRYGSDAEQKYWETVNGCREGYLRRRAARAAEVEGGKPEDGN